MISPAPCSLCTRYRGIPHLHTPDDAPLHWIVWSATTAGQLYLVRFHSNGATQCTCPAGSSPHVPRRCWHVHLAQAFETYRLPPEVPADLPGVLPSLLLYLRASNGDQRSQLEILQLLQDEAALERNLPARNHYALLIDRWFQAQLVNLKLPGRDTAA
jgi:hypothetical protein